MILLRFLRQRLLETFGKKRAHRNDTPARTVGLSQRIKTTQHDNPFKRLFTFKAGGWLSSFVFQVTSTRFVIFPASILFASAPSPSWSKFAPTCCLSRSNPSPWRPKKGHESFLLAAHRDIAADPIQCFRRWLGHFSLEQIELLECLFQRYGQMPRNELINPL